MFYDDISVESLRAHRMIAISHRKGRHGLGRTAPGFLDGRALVDLRWARKLGAKELQLLILALLAERPAHGYELIKTIEERSCGFYCPSPGMVYPALTYLDEIGYASIEQEGTRKLYRITPDGQAHLNTNRAAADAILEILSRIGSRMDDVREAFAGVDDSDPSDEIHRARRALKDALRRKRGCDAQEAKRIARILTLAAAQILGG